MGVMVGTLLTKTGHLGEVVYQDSAYYCASPSRQISEPPPVSVNTIVDVDPGYSPGDAPRLRANGQPSSETTTSGEGFCR